MSKVNEINLALKDFSNGKKEKAYNKLKAIFKKNIDDEKLRFNLAVIAQSLNRNEEAKENYIFLVKKNNNIKAMVNLYLLYIGEDNFSKALEIINKLIKDNKNHGIYRDKAFVLYKLKKYDESISICEDFLKNKFDINIMNILGLNYLSKNDFNKSEEIFKKALKIDKHSALILNSLGRNYHERRDPKKLKNFT